MSHSPQRKIVSPAALAQLVREAQAAGRTVVHCHGCFDIVHPGHVRYLQAARQLGDVLIVSLTADHGIRKGPDRPYISQDLRAENLAALEFVDWVVIDEHETAVELLELLRPDVYVKGREYATSTDERFVRERAAVESYGGRVVFHSGDVVFSSTRLIETLARDPQLESCRLGAFCRRNGIDAALVRRTLDGFAALRVLVIGDVLRESYVLCDARQMAADAPVPALQRLGERAYWGGAAAVALQAAALGAQVRLLCAGGGDDATPELVSACRDADVAIELLAERPGLPLHTTFVADDAKLFELTAGAGAPLDTAAERRLSGRVRELLAESELLIVCEQGYGLVWPGIAGVLREAHDRGIRTAGVAPGARGDLTLLAGVDLLATTERQAREAMHDMTLSLPAVIWNLLQRVQGRAALVALPKRGLIGFENPADGAAGGGRLKGEYIAAPAGPRIDLRGAEEALGVAGALTLAAGGSVWLATYLASVAESLCAARMGRGLATAAQLAQRLAERPELAPAGRFVPDPPEWRSGPPAWQPGRAERQRAWRVEGPPVESGK